MRESYFSLTTQPSLVLPNQRMYLYTSHTYVMLGIFGIDLVVEKVGPQTQSSQCGTSRNCQDCGIHALSSARDSK